MHVQRVLAWHLVINYPQSIFVAALFLLLNCRYTEILSESQVSKMQTRIQLSALILVSPLPDTYVTAIQTTELTVRSMSGQRRDHARRTTRPAWRLAINYPPTVNIPAITEFVPPLDTIIRTKNGTCTYNAFLAWYFVTRFSQYLLQLFFFFWIVSRFGLAVRR